MRRTQLLTIAATAAISALPAGAQVYTSPDVQILRAPRARMEMDYQDEHRAAIGVSTTATGTLRDTLGLMITSITKNSPAERAGLEEGNRLAAINGVSLRASAADVEDAELSGSLTRRLTRELARAKPGDEVELRVYRDGRTQAMKVKTVDSDSLFRRRDIVRVSRSQMEDRPALGFSIGSTGSRRDTLGVLVMAVADSTPAARAGIEEGNRIAAINGISLRVPREDAGDRYLSSAKAQRLQREISQLKPGSDVTLRVYSSGQSRDVTMKVARAGDLPRNSNNMMFLGGMGGMLALPPMPPMPPMPAMPRARDWPMDGFHFELGPQIEEGLHEAGVQLERVRPQLDRLLRDLPAALENFQMPIIRIDVDAPTTAPVPAVKKVETPVRQTVSM
jgi:C-terminal processing protease CtpA/Prc